MWGEGVRLVILDSPYRLLLEPLLEYIEEIAAQRQPNEIITIVVPQFVPKRWWHNLLHTQTATCAAPGAAVQARHRDHRRAVSGGMTDDDE